MKRRTLLKQGAMIAGAAFTHWAPSAWAQPTGANNRIRVGLIGLGIKGMQHLRTIQTIAGVRVTALCDVDPVRLAEAKSELNQNGHRVFETTDLRRVIEHQEVDAVIIAAATHWHALATVWACQAGKDVYVEKPVGRTIGEGRVVLEASQRYGRIVQTGTQLRSDSDLDEILEYIHSGELGRIQWIQGVSYKMRTPLDWRPLWYPDWLDYDLYCGPTPFVPLERNRLHYDWHWRWRTGNGDLVNMGVHAIDKIRRFLGDEIMPRRVLSVGGRYAVDDVSDIPNTQLTVWDFDGIPVYYENRNLPMRPGSRSADRWRGQRIGIIVQCEHGYYGGLNGGDVFDNDGNRLMRKGVEVDTVTVHLENFFDAIRSGRESDLKAPPQIGHDSAMFGHFGNLSYRVGRPTTADTIDAALEPFPEGINAVERMREHVRAHGADLETDPMTMGSWLELDCANDSIIGIGEGDERGLAMARSMISEAERPGFTMPKLT